MNILEKTEQLCKLYKITPQRSKGQNFLIVEKFYDDIIEAAEITKNDLVLEVGPGLGFLTAKLAAKAKKVVTVELDDKLAELLKSTIAEQKIDNVSIINGNVLDLEVESLKSKVESPESQHTPAFGHPSQEGNLGQVAINSPLERGGSVSDGVCCDYKIVANLPYNITSVFLRKFLEQVKNKPTSMVLMLQKEVAERIVAKPGEMSILAISVQYYAEAEIVVDVVPAKAFWPAPKVDSAIIKIRTKGKVPTRVIPVKTGIHKDLKSEEGDVLDPHLREDYTRADQKYTKDFFRLVKFGFSAKRKKLSHNLAAGFHIEKSEALLWMKQAGLGENVRAQELSLEDWYRLLKIKD